MRIKRDKQAASIPEWEQLRETASAIKKHTLSRLAEYLEEFERQASANGIHVHWARDGAEHNAIVLQILSERGITRLVKSKSMLTEECHLNPYLESHGIEVTDTGLGERIVQLGQEPPSHIVLPAIHLKKEDIGRLFHEKLGTENGAVWVSGSSLGPQRAVYVICEHLVLVVPAGQIVHTMQQAYDRIQFERPGFGVFLSGPSKTADIEQSLVVGAQGARSCTLFLVV